MAKSQFTVVVGGADWGSPLAEQPTFPSLEEAQAAAAEYLQHQRKNGGAPPAGRVLVEETTADGKVIKHSIN